MELEKKNCNENDKCDHRECVQVIKNNNLKDPRKEMCCFCQPKEIKILPLPKFMLNNVMAQFRRIENEVS